MGILRYKLAFFAAGMAIVMLSGCGISIPEEKREYIGRWKAPNMVLQISENGSVEYERTRNGNRTKISAPIKRFQGDDFVVGIWFIKTTFNVSKPPYHNGRQWKMVVDGVELTRSGGSGGVEIWTRYPFIQHPVKG